MQDVSKEALRCDVVSDERLDRPEVSLRQIFHQLGTFERFLNLVEDAARAGPHFLEFADEGGEAAAAVGKTLELAKGLISRH